KPLIAIDSNTANDCFEITREASHITVKGLSVYDAGNAVKTGEFTGNPLTGSGTNRVIDSMFLGVLPDGQAPSLTERNSSCGVRVETIYDAGDIPIDGSAVPIYLTVTHCYVGWNGETGILGGQAVSIMDVEFNEVFQNAQ